jgi:cellulose synthase/poly-beta-1,6-N-acetylglucosamine synthase-like glycosyltransferase
MYAIFSFALAISYLILIFVYLYHWRKSPSLQLPEDFEPSTSLSVIIPIRNEAEYIVDLLRSIQANNYPEDLLEIIVIDDHSTDGSAEKVKKLNAGNIKILSLRELKLSRGFNSYKKYGISKAIEIAQGDFIMTTDGDCIVPDKWLQYFAYSFEVKQKIFVAAPVNFIPSDNPLVSFQALDFMGMMLVTGANIERNKSLLCNGASLGYAKKLFTEVGGYEGISEQASGDDVMLMNKIATGNQEDIFFIKNREATVKTKAITTWSAFVQIALGDQE